MVAIVWRQRARGTSAYVNHQVTTFMMDKVQLIDPGDVKKVCALLGKISALSMQASKQGGPTRSAGPEWDETWTPYRAKKTRRLANSPTDVSLG